MLAQDQPSSAKRGGLAAVSSGLIFLKKKKRVLFQFCSLRGEGKDARIPRQMAGTKTDGLKDGNNKN